MCEYLFAALQELGTFGLGSPEGETTPGDLRSEEGLGHGHWQRRRRLDGALNRVPPDFYSDVWHILESVSSQLDATII